MRRHGDGTFGASSEYGSGGAAIGVATGDFNRDGRLDLVTAHGHLSYPNANTAGVLLNAGGGAFGPFTNYATDATTSNATYAVAVADFNGDGLADFAASNGTSRTLDVLQGDGAGAFGGPIRVADRGGSGLTVGDFNGDGLADLATTSTGQVCVALNTTR